MRAIIYLFLCCGFVLSSCSKGTKRQIENEWEAVVIGFPSELGMGQTWNRSLMKRVGQIIGLESRRVGMDSLSLPPFKYGDSPYLVAELGIEMSKGLHAAIPVRGMDRRPEGNVGFRAAFERIVEESGVLVEKTYDDISNISAADWEKEQKDHAAVAVQACRESIVLLKNKGNILPMDSSARIYHSSPYYNKKDREGALADAGEADVIALFWDVESAGKNESKAWLDEFNGLGKPVVLVLTGNRSFAVDSSVEASVDAVVAAWFPKMMSYEWIGDIIHGNYSPGSRLTAAIYDTTGNLLYPMGYGLSYTSVDYSDLTLETIDSEKGRNIVVRFNATNTGDRVSDEVALLYLKRVSGEEMPEGVRLEGFKRTNLQPGQTKEIKFTIRKRNVERVDEDMKGYVEPGEYEVRLSGDVTPQYFIIGADGEFR